MEPDTEAVGQNVSFYPEYEMVDTGQAQYYTEIAAAITRSLTPEDGRQTMHTLFESGIYGWLYPNTDFIILLRAF